jgi:succinate dehydrogenase/fumarate reductase-like Fe-S protein
MRQHIRDVELDTTDLPARGGNKKSNKNQNSAAKLEVKEDAAAIQRRHDCIGCVGCVGCIGGLQLTGFAILRVSVEFE